MANLFGSKKIMEKLNISAEAKEKIGESALEYFCQFLINLLERMCDLSRWCLAGSLTSTFAILLSINELKSFYDGGSIKWFLGLQISSILFGIWYLFWQEFQSAAARSSPHFFNAMVTMLQSIDSKLLEENKLKHQDLVDELVNSYSEKAPKVALKVFKSSFSALVQVFLLVLGLIILSFNAFVKI